MTEQSAIGVENLLKTAYALGTGGLLAETRHVCGIHSLDIIVGGQYGSEAKGHVTQQVIKDKMKDAVFNGDEMELDFPILNIRVAGPNAGHTVYADVRDNSFEQPVMKKFAFRQLPVGVVEDANKVYCAIAAGSEIELEVLLAEIGIVKGAGLWPEHQIVIVDPEATLLVPEDHNEEKWSGLTERIGSTGKGVGAARQARLGRIPGRRLVDSDDAIKALTDAGCIVRPLEWLYSYDPSLVADGDNIKYQIVIEGTQGFGLGLHAGDYPQCTSSDCRAVDFLAMAGISPWAVDQKMIVVWVVFRPFPIRVAGNSGPLFGETVWADLGLPEERTTVTQKIRRVGQWDAALASDAVRANGGPSVNVRAALTMADQVDPAVAGVTDMAELYKSDAVSEFITRVAASGAVVDMVTTSPFTAVWL